MDDLRVQVIDMRWTQALKDHYFSGGDARAFVAQSEEFVSELSRIGGDAADELAYVIEFTALQVRFTDGDTTFFPEMKRLLALHRSDPARYPANPSVVKGSTELVDEDGDPLDNYLDIYVASAPTILAGDPDASLEQIEESLALADDYFADPERTRRIRVRALVTMNRTAEAVELLAGQVPSADDATADADGEYAHWLIYMDSVVRAYLAENQLELAVKALDEMRRVEPAGHLPHITAAAALRQLTQLWEPGVDMRTVELVLSSCMGSANGVYGVYDVATYLCARGNVEDALVLAEQSETYIDDPEDFLEMLAVFFRAVVDAGSGERLFGRFTAPRWQHYAGTDPLRVTCEALASDFHAAATARARIYDARNGNTGDEDRLNKVYQAPPATDHKFHSVSVAALAPVPEPLFSYPTIGEGMDPQLGRAVAVFVGVEEPEPGTSPFPPAFEDNEEINRLRAQMGERGEQLQEAIRGLYQMALDPSTDDTVRAMLSIMMYSLEETANFPATTSQPARCR